MSKKGRQSKLSSKHRNFFQLGTTYKLTKKERESWPKNKHSLQINGTKLLLMRSTKFQILQ